ncbi:MAG: chemotaxis protein CheD [Deltaproteobacteria bacterium CG_4_10_14_3_um_filter_60_8]|nr:MAG: chemotaxis protein CheD [Desulfobacterales bacterium CG2_30_60_27]PIP43349.1 MAG: chemotaxis protein CheD [Deltaproteobacteria bacterium CG23_combo_of_CG06-09_8_20_14_all_60_8]PIY21122.1 MAG: chemotaxis protein CheD [Deltaproteobacteria bacterium CG_4_10_14_3_um_filter_60_8]
MKVIVGISDMKVSKNPTETLITYSLGSCIGVLIYDPGVKVGGLLHYMLPDATIDKQKALDKPFMFATTGIPRLFKEAYNLGATKNRLLVKVVGGAQILDSAGVFNIGKRNYLVLREMFWKNKVMIAKEDVGGTVNRTISLDIGSGLTILKTSGQGEAEI